MVDNTLLDPLIFDLQFIFRDADLAHLATADKEAMRSYIFGKIPGSARVIDPIFKKYMSKRALHELSVSVHHAIQDHWDQWPAPDDVAVLFKEAFWNYVREMVREMLTANTTSPSQAAGPVKSDWTMLALGLFLFTAFVMAFGGGGKKELDPVIRGGSSGSPAEQDEEDEFAFMI